VSDFDDTEIAKNHLMMLMPIEFSRYIKLTLAGDFAFAIRNKIDEKDKRIKELENELQKYNELIMAVQNKWPNQTRHETALKYIMQAENSDNCCAKEAKLEGESE